MIKLLFIMETYKDFRYFLKIIDIEEIIDSRYQNGKIYGIHYEKKIIYIGSTIRTLIERFGEHKYDMTRRNSPLYQFMKENDLSKFNIVLIEDFPCNSKKELNNREGLYQRKYKDTLLNDRIEGRTKKEYHEDNKKQIKKYMYEYRIKNNDKLKEYDKNRKNKEERYKKHNEWSKIPENKLKLKEKERERRKNKIICPCGSKYSIRIKPKHFQTKKHQDYIKKLEETNEFSSIDEINEFIIKNSKEVKEEIEPKNEIIS